MPLHTEPHPLAGKTVKIKQQARHFQKPDFGGSDFRLEDWWDRVGGKSWRVCDGNVGCCVYGMRIGLSHTSVGGGIPPDDEVVYGHIGGLGHLVHVSELEDGK
jgi:hypothetical protein